MILDTSVILCIIQREPGWEHHSRTIQAAEHLLISAQETRKARQVLSWTELLYILSMTIETTYSAAREQLKTLMDRVVADRDVVVVRRRKGGDVALVAAEELEGLLETAHLLRSPRNAERLLSALERARREELPPLFLEDLSATLEA